VAQILDYGTHVTGSHDKEVKHMASLKRTSISDLSALGDELSEEHMRLATGGMAPRMTTNRRGLTGGSVAPTYSDTFKMDTCTDPNYD
jgi:hypothetical protein